MPQVEFWRVARTFMMIGGRAADACPRSRDEATTADADVEKRILTGANGGSVFLGRLTRGAPSDRGKRRFHGLGCAGADGEKRLRCWYVIW